jgi:integrase
VLFRSIALGTALQFEGLFRQKDVIGEWEPITDKPTSLYVMNSRQWVKGMTWDMLNMGVFSKKTVKRQKVVSHDVSLYPITMSLIQLIPEEKRLFGPVIIDERAGRPYANWAYGKEWLRIAREAGVIGVWNMDARAGGISEALASGGSMSDTQKVAGHSDPRMTSKYERMPGLSQAKRIAIARSACRDANSNG